MAPQQAEDQPSLLGNAREPPHVEGVIHMTGQMIASGIKDEAVRAPDGSVGQLDSSRHDLLHQHPNAQVFDNMQLPVPGNDNVKHIGNDGQDIGRDESQRERGPQGRVEANVNVRDMEEKDKELEADADEYRDDKDRQKDKDQEDYVPDAVEVRTVNVKFMTIYQLLFLI